MFVLHMLSSDQPFLPRDLFRDRNLMLGLTFTAVTGLLMIVTATLLPPFLQQLKGYPVFTTGIVMAPRGIGTMLSMFLVSRLIGKVDARWLIAIGLGLCAVSLYDMTLFTLDVSEVTDRLERLRCRHWARAGLSAAHHARLRHRADPHPHRGRGDERADAKSRRVGRGRHAGRAARPQHADQPLRAVRASDGVQPVVAVRHHADRARHSGRPARIIQHMMPFGGGWPFGSVPIDDPSRLIAVWSEELNRQAASIAYLNDFRVLAIAAVIFIPALLFMRRQAMLARPSRR